MRRVDVLASLALMVLALLGIFIAIPQETTPGEPGEIAPADLPRLALWVIVISGAWQLVISIKGRDETPNPLDRFALGFLVASTAILFLALAGIWTLGYAIGGVLCVFAIGAAMRPRGLNWLWLAAVSLALPIGVYYLSWHGLRLSLP